MQANHIAPIQFDAFSGSQFPPVDERTVGGTKLGEDRVLSELADQSVFSREVG